MTPSSYAKTLQTIYETQNIAAFAQLLSDTIFWGDPAYPADPNACHDTTSVVARYQSMLSRGVTARVIDVLEGEETVALGLAVVWPPGIREDPPQNRYQIFHFRKGRIDRITGATDRASAEAAML